MKEKNKVPANFICVCDNKGYIVARRDDGRFAVERCDECQWFGLNDPRTRHDEDAAQWAQADGIYCQKEYPCTLVDQNHACLNARR